MDVAIDRADVNPSATAASMTTTRRSGGKKVIVAAKVTLILLFFALSAIRLEEEVIFDRIHTARDTLLSHTMVASRWAANRLPGVKDTRRRLTAYTTSGRNAASLSSAAGRSKAKALSAEGADMEWEKSESLLRQLHNAEASNKKGGGGRGGNNNNNVFHRTLEGLEGVFNLNNKKEGRRHLKATINEEKWDDFRIPSSQEVKQFVSDTVSTISGSPIATAILTLCGVAVLIVSVVMTPDNRRLRRLADLHENRTIVLDEEEAEILEFYEKEMVTGIPFFENTQPADDCRDGGDDDTSSNDKQKQGQCFARSSLSDTFLARHDISGEARVSACDSYYSRVLHDIGGFDELEEGPQNALREDKSDSSLESVADSATEDDQLKPSDKEEQEQRETNNQEDDRPSSPTSPSSSISSLTSENFADIESQSSSQPGDDNGTNMNSRGGLKRRRSVETKSKASRRVSFSPEVKVREIPRQTSSERHLYLMLLIVAIVIAFCSLLPAPHPSLSVPISDMPGEMIQRADNILKSQFEVEL